MLELTNIFPPPEVKPVKMLWLFLSWENKLWLENKLVWGCTVIFDAEELNILVWELFENIFNGVELAKILDGGDLLPNIEGCVLENKLLLLSDVLLKKILFWVNKFGFYSIFFDYDYYF